MYDLSEQDIEGLVSEESREVRLPNGIALTVNATRHHWLVVEELEADYHWTREEIARLTLQESQETGRDFATCFRYLLAYIQADARHILDSTVEGAFTVPLLPNAYQPRDLPA